MKTSAKIGVIGGSGLYEMPGVKKSRELTIKTPFGAPSGPIVVGELSGVPCAFLPRHGKGHVLLPTELPTRANIWALKSLGVERVIAVSAVGSLREELPPRTFVFPTQLVDRTKGRVSTFFGGGIVAHVAFDTPFCLGQNDLLHETAGSLGLKVSKGGVYCCMEGPLFSTKAESELHRQAGFSLIGMTAVPEAKLAREAELCYSMVALVTDYDCWKEGEEVDSATVIGHLQANVASAQTLLAAAVARVAALPRRCRCGQALENAIFTNPKHIAKKAAKNLDLLIRKRLKR